MDSTDALSRSRCRERRLNNRHKALQSPFLFRTHYTHALPAEWW